MAKEMSDTWLLRSAPTNKPSTINKLLREGFEPFWGYNIADGVVKMYFRKPPEVKSNPIKIDTKTFEKALEELLSNILKEFYVKLDTKGFEESLENILNENRSFFSGVLDNFYNKLSNTEFKMAAIPTDVGIGGNTYYVPLPSPDDIDDENDEGEENEELHNPSRELTGQFADRLTVEDDGGFLSPDDFVAKKSPRRGEEPKGDSFRVVDEVPETLTQGRTEAQDAMIANIRSRHETNITVGPPADGVVTVWAENMIYYIRPDGSVREEQNKASRSSLI